MGDAIADAVEVKSSPKRSKATSVVNVIFVSSEKMRELNLQFRKKNKSTDVLSFEPSDDETFGELAVCAEYVETSCLKLRKKFLDQLLRVMIHGCLHLLGYNHESGGRQAATMLALQEQIHRGLWRRWRVLSKVD